MSFVGHKTVYFLLDIIELSVAKAHYFGIVKQCVRKTAVAVDKFLAGFRSLAVAPAVRCLIGPAYSAILADEYRQNSVIGLAVFKVRISVDLVIYNALADFFVI